MTAFLACPRCLRSDTLFENVRVSAWRELRPIPVDGDGRAAIDEDRDPWDPNRAYAGRQQEVEWDGLEFESYGCSCSADHEMRRSDLAVVTDEGEEWIPPHPGQGTLV